MLTKFFFGISIHKICDDEIQKSYLNFTFRCYKKYYDIPLFKLKAVERLLINEKLYETFQSILSNFMEDICLNNKFFFEEIPFQTLIYVNDMILCNYKR